MSDSDHLNYITQPGESQSKSRETLYEFDVGTVRLEWDEKPTRFYAMRGEDCLMQGLPPGAELNPFIALTYFLRGISEEMRPKIKCWLQRNGYNTVTGCRVNMACSDCRRAGLDVHANGCPKIGGTKK